MSRCNISANGNLKAHADFATIELEQSFMWAAASVKMGSNQNIVAFYINDRFF